MMKIKLTLFLLVFCSALFSETYILHQELTRFGNPGEIETIVLKRHKGEYFKVITDDYNELFDLHNVHSETAESLIIISTEQYSKAVAGFNVYVINKKDMTWGQRYIIPENLEESMDRIGSFGKYTVIKD